MSKILLKASGAIDTCSTLTPKAMLQHANKEGRDRSLLESTSCKEEATVGEDTIVVQEEEALGQVCSLGCA
jgi:hypothetical protein